MKRMSVMKKKLALPCLLLLLCPGGCRDAKEIGPEAGQKLEATASIATEIQSAHQIECHPYLKLEGDVARVELTLDDPDFDHQSLATEITKLGSVQSFEGELHLVFHHTPTGSEAPTIWVKYDARTGKPLEK